MTLCLKTGGGSCSAYGKAVYKAMDFEWDPAKALANVGKHGIDFPSASRAFDDPRLLSEIDPRDYGQEVRFRAIGVVGEELILVCFTMRGGICRTISARRANRREREAYSVSAGDRQAGRPN